MPIYAALSALMFRLRGASLIGKTTIGRLLFALSLGAAAFFFGEMPLLTASLLAMALFIGTIFPTFGAIDMGTNGGSLLKKALLMYLRGLLYVAPASLVIFFFSDLWWYLVIAGASAPIWYGLGHYGPLKKYGTELGELGLGAAIGTALGLMLWP